jgi:hypothetical protein
MHEVLVRGDTPITLGPGTYSISGFGSYTFDFGAAVHATYDGLGAVAAYDSYYPTGSPTQAFIIGGGTTANPSFGPGWTALGDPKMGDVSFTFSAVPEPGTYALVSGLALACFGIWRRKPSR